MSARDHGRNWAPETPPGANSQARVGGPPHALVTLMGMHKARRAKVRQLCSEAGVIRPSDTVEVGSSPAQLRAMHKRGELKRVGHGLYVNASAQLSEMAVDLARLQRRSSGVFICGVSAAFLHGLLSDGFGKPVWFGLPANARRPTGFEGYFFSYFSGRRANTGIHLEPWAGLNVRLASPARAVCELFSRRKSLGAKIPRVALREYLDRGHPKGDLIQPASLFGVGPLITAASLAPEVVLTPEEIQAYVDAFSDRATKVSHRQNRGYAPVKIGESKPASTL